MLQNVKDIVDIAMNSGVTIVMLAYFIYRDITFQNKLEETLATLQKTVDMVFNRERSDSDGNS